MREPLRVFIGYDEREIPAWHVLAHSILARATCPVALIPLIQPTLRESGAYTRERGPTESTSFSLTRFLVPYLSGYWGTSVFLDCDILCRVDVNLLWRDIGKADMKTPLAAGERARLIAELRHQAQRLLDGGRIVIVKFCRFHIRFVGIDFISE